MFEIKKKKTMAKDKYFWNQLESLQDMTFFLLLNFSFF